MEKLLKEISVIPGVSGSCIFDKNEGVVCSEPDGNLPQDLTGEVGINFVRLVQMGIMNRLQIRSAHFRFDRYSVVGIPLEKGAILLAICDAQANCSLVATTAAMLVEDMRDELEKPGSPPEAEDKSAAPPLPIVSAEEISSDLRPHLKEIEEALATAIGPVAAMVMADYLNRWRQSGPAAPPRLAELVAMLGGEIDDPVLAQEFSAHLRHLL